MTRTDGLWSGTRRMGQSKGPPATKAHFCPWCFVHSEQPFEGMCTCRAGRKLKPGDSIRNQLFLPYPVPLAVLGIPFSRRRACGCVIGTDRSTRPRLRAHKFCYGARFLMMTLNLRKSCSEVLSAFFPYTSTVNVCSARCTGRYSVSRSTGSRPARRINCSNSPRRSPCTVVAPASW